MPPRVSPLALLAATYRDLEPALAAGGLRLAIEYGTVLPETIASDEARLRELLSVLLRAAVQLAEKPDLRLIVTLLDLPSPQSPLLCFEAELFTSRQDALATTRPAHVSRGRDDRGPDPDSEILLNARQLARGLGGDIYASGQEDGHSRILACIETGPLDGTPLLGADQPFLVTVADTEAMSSLPTSLAGRVLFVMPPRPEHQVCLIHLRQVGIETKPVASQADALRALEKASREGRPFDLIIVDADDPAVTGKDWPRRLQETGLNVPLVELTRRAGPAGEPASTGFAEHWTKPIDRAWLLTRLAALIGPRGPSSSAPSRVAEAVIDDGMREVTDEFLAWLPERASSLSEAFRAGDPVAVKQIAHQLKGTAGMCGFAAIATAAGELEVGVARLGAVTPFAAHVTEVVELCRDACCVRQE